MKLSKRVLCASLVGILVAPVSAQGKETKLEKEYSAHWHACWDLKDCDPGRNIRRDNVQTKKGTREARPTELKRSLATLKSNITLARAPISTRSSQNLSVSATSTSTSSYSTSGSVNQSFSPNSNVPSSGGGTPSESTAQCESGGSYNARNGPYYGKWQIDVGLHYGRGGVCQGGSLDPAGQDRCAAKILATQGPGAWPVCG